MTSLIHRFDTSSSVLGWQPINDGVMGGVSFSRMQFDPAGHAVFAGEVSLLNNGGFASVRAPLRLGGPDTTAYCITAWGDGRTYKLNLRTDAGFDGLSYQASFTPAKGKWIQTELPLVGFSPTFRGKLLSDAPCLQPAMVTQIGLMISGRQAGSFRLLLNSIEAVGVINANVKTHG